jgi:hypothetical protein
MSSPAHDDADRQVIYALPWVSDPRRLEEARRLEEEVIEAAQRLERESSQEMNQGVLAPLTPEYLALPPRERIELPGLGMATGLVGAIAVAAAIALVVANVVQIPTLGTTKDSSPAVVLENLNGVGTAQAKMRSADDPPAPTRPLLAAIPANDIALPKAPAPTPLPSSEPERARPKIAAPTTAAPREPRAEISLTHDEIVRLLKRGRDLIAAGDIASARLILTHLAEAGDAEASFTLAETFDAAVLAKLRVVGVQPDAAKANAWYARAAKQGSLEAERRLAQSAPR